jgi:hypothetical protein
MGDLMRFTAADGWAFLVVGLFALALWLYPSKGFRPRSRRSTNDSASGVYISGVHDGHSHGHHGHGGFDGGHGGHGGGDGGSGADGGGGGSH